MDRDDVLRWLDDGLARFCASERDLDLGIHERTLSGRLLVHLDSSLLDDHAGWHDAGWRLDTEYDKVGTIFAKRLPELDETLDALAGRMGWRPEQIPRRETNRVYPDLILHKRQSGFVDGNGVVCEVKRATEGIEGIARDIGKLIKFRDWLNYQHAYVLLLARERRDCSILSVGRDVSDGATILQLILEARAAGRVPSQ